MNDIYTHYYSNSRHDGYINVVPNCNGSLNWKKEFSGYAEKHLENRVILISDELIIIDNMSEILCLDTKGNSLWKRDKWYGTQVVIRDKIIYYTSSSRKDRMEAVTFDNNLIIEDFIIWEIVQGSYLSLFEPARDELIAQIQYTGIQEASTDKFVIYKIGKKSLGYDWNKIFLKEASPLIPHVNFEKGFLLTAIHSDVLLFNLTNNKKDAEPQKTFPLPSLAGNVFVSSSKDGLLYFGYAEKDKVILKCYDQNGTELFKVENQEEFIGYNKVIAPPILVNDFIYLLSNHKLICINNAKIRWVISSEGLPFSYATGLADNSILVSQTNKIINYSSEGRVTFSFEIKEPISAPPVVDKNGMVYFCSKSKLYSLK